MTNEFLRQMALKSAKTEWEKKALEVAPRILTDDEIVEVIVDDMQRLVDGQHTRADRAQAELNELREILTNAYGEDGDLVFIAKVLTETPFEEDEFDRLEYKII